MCVIQGWGSHPQSYPMARLHFETNERLCSRRKKSGVNGSKTIVVINNDKEAPFFKSADYGIIGDAFTILPKFTEAVKKFKANQN